MDKKFLEKVLDQIVSETRIDYSMEEIQFPFYPSPFFSPLHLFSTSLSVFITPFSFSNHCREVYGLNEQETKYVWEEYIKIIKDKINSNGL